jgi:hypothetical protein
LSARIASQNPDETLHIYDSKTALRDPAAVGTRTYGFSSLVRVVVIGRKPTYRKSVAIPAIAETKNTRTRSLKQSKISSSTGLPLRDTGGLLGGKIFWGFSVI